MADTAGHATALPAPAALKQPSLLVRLFDKPQPVLEELAAAHGPNYGFGAGPVRIAVIGKPSTLRELLAMPTDNFRWGHKFNVLGFVVGDESMITLIISRISQRLDVSARSTAVPEPVGMVVNQPAGGAPMRVRARQG